MITTLNFHNEFTSELSLYMLVPICEVREFKYKSIQQILRNLANNHNSNSIGFVSDNLELI